ncbi:hypothetical protein BGZ68_004403 [Mortierella alpina]|nr:hypothetical protein BGZ68_004403 [Mortierella alpina]
MWAPSFSTVRVTQRWIIALACCSIIVFLFTLTLGVATIQYPRIVTTVAVAVFAYYKIRMTVKGRRLVVLCLSCLSAMLFLFYAACLISLAQAAENIVFFLYFSGGLDVSIAIILLIEGVLTDLYSIHLNSKRASSARNPSTDSCEDTRATSTPQEPLPVHVYQPRLSLMPNERTSTQSGTAVPLATSDEAAHQEDYSVKLEELPKYQRKRPAQHATIVDMANLGSVDATFSRSSMSLSSLDVANDDGMGHEQGQELRWELGGDILTIEAPEHSPSSEEAPAETPVPLASAAPTHGLSPLVAYSYSRSPVILSMPLSDAPAEPPATEPAGAPSLTVTPAPPVYAP